MMDTIYIRRNMFIDNNLYLYFLRILLYNSKRHLSEMFITQTTISHVVD